MARLARSFNDMAASLQLKIGQLEDLSRVQRRFVSDVSHELRTPLTTVRMAADVLHEARDSFDPATARSAELLQTQLDRFEALLADLLEISRFDAGAATLDPVQADIRDTVTSVVEALQPLAERSGTEILLTLPKSGAVAEYDPRRSRPSSAQPAGQRHRAQRGASDRGVGSHVRGSGRGRRSRSRDRSAARRVIAGVQPVLAG